MKDKYFFVVVGILFVIGLSIPLYSIFSPNKFGEVYAQYYEVIENSLKETDANITEISVSEYDYSKTGIKEIALKEINTDDQKLKETLNSVLLDIRDCYLKSADSKILSYKNKRNISDKVLEEISSGQNCLDVFAKYNTMSLSDDEVLTARLKGQIKLITDYDKAPTLVDFSSLIFKESDIVKRIENLSKWLKIEYNTYATNES